MPHANADLEFDRDAPTRARERADRNTNENTDTTNAPRFGGPGATRRRAKYSHPEWELRRGPKNRGTVRQRAVEDPTVRVRAPRSPSVARAARDEAEEPELQVPSCICERCGADLTVVEEPAIERLLSKMIAALAWIAQTEANREAKAADKVTAAAAGTRVVTEEDELDNLLFLEWTSNGELVTTRKDPLRVAREWSMSSC